MCRHLILLSVAVDCVWIEVVRKRENGRRREDICTTKGSRRYPWRAEH